MVTAYSCPTISITLLPMTEDAFIRTYRYVVGDTTIGTVTCQNLIFDHGVIYSGGEHHPLLFLITRDGGDQFLFVNTNPATEETARHIEIAMRYAGFSVCLPSEHRGIPSVSHVVSALEVEREEMKIHLANERNIDQRERVTNNLRSVESTLFFLTHTHHPTPHVS